MLTRNHSFTPVLSIAGLIAATLGCSNGKSDSPPKRPKKTPPKVTTTDAAPTVVPQPADPRHYKVTNPLPPRDPCEKDSDCDGSAYEPGDCCPDRCAGDSPHAGTREWVAAVRAMRDKACADFDGNCPRVKCDFFARQCELCEQGKCVRSQGKACTRVLPP